LREVVATAVAACASDAGPTIDRTMMGIDGVSLGGAFALRLGLGRDSSFRSVGAIQPALDRRDTDELVSLAVDARRARPKLSLRLATSDEDYFREGIRAVAAGWTQTGVAHRLVTYPGPHDYVFNRGPGSIELLLWHDGALSTKSAVP
jgi:enterochelin esterase-like enzyme